MTVTLVGPGNPPLSLLETSDQLGYARSIFETVDTALLLLGKDGVVRMANAAYLRMLAVTAEETVGHSFPDLADSCWNTPVVMTPLAALGHTGVAFREVEITGNFSTVGTRVMLVSGCLLDVPHNDDRMTLVAIVDVTSARLIEQALAWHATELERSNRDLESYAMVASHDLQEPLRKIRAYGDLMLTEFGETLTPEAQDYATRMVSASARMQTLVADLLRLAVVGTSTQRFARVNLGDVIREVLVDMELVSREAGSTLTAGPMPTIECDRPQMRQLFQNLISNAIKFRREVPSIISLSMSPADVPAFVGAAAGAPWVAIKVQDNGIGFEERHAQVIFDPFQRLHGRGKFEGSGIGLTLCRRICERHFGFLTAESSPNVGTVFTILLPTRRLLTQ
jgi:two-component system, LuxR family, sensor kinase FixL